MTKPNGTFPAGGLTFAKTKRPLSSTPNREQLPHGAQDDKRHYKALTLFSCVFNGL